MKKAGMKYIEKIQNYDRYGKLTDIEKYEIINPCETHVSQSLTDVTGDTKCNVPIGGSLT